MLKPTERFTCRVENYVKYRPGYPLAVLDLLRVECGLTSGSVIADIGSGTGIFTRMFLENGNRVYGVEPNKAMREAGEQLLAGYPSFMSIAATAEETTLPDQSIDFITAGQAFHWFNLARTRPEFARILKPDGWVVLIWNARRVSSTTSLTDYEQFIKTYGTDYGNVNHTNLDGDDFQRFYEPGSYRLTKFENQQVFDFEGLKGRLLSSSYAPGPDHPNYEPMLADLRRLFDAHQVDGVYTIEYDTEVFYGQLTAGRP
jgi:SAM-dependent methyltransferase